MKKILIALCFTAGFTGIAAAQTAQKKAPAVLKLEKAKSKARINASKSALKKDATLDLQTNGQTAGREIAKGPLKKDGSTDSRFTKVKRKKG